MTPNFVTVNVHVYRPLSILPVGNKAVDEGSLLDFTVGTDNPAGRTLLFGINSLPEGASFDPLTGRFEWMPGYDQAGTYRSSFEVTDGTQGDAEDIVITVNDKNRAPVVVEDIYTIDEDTLLTDNVLVNDFDYDGDSIYAVLTSDVACGTLTLNEDGSFTYVPYSNCSGIDSFRYTAYDGKSYSWETYVEITINPVNDAPVARDVSLDAIEDTPVSGSFDAIDMDGNGLTASVVSGPSHGSVIRDIDGSFTYVPAQDFSGTDSFTYLVNDSVLNSNIATITITVSQANDAPVAKDVTLAVSEDVPASGSFDVSDIDGDKLTVSVFSGPSHGSLTINIDGTFTYTPDVNYFGADSFTYRASDGTLDSSVATVTITVDSVNDAPTATGDAYTTDEDVALIIAAPGVQGNGEDVEGNALSAVLVAGPSHGSLTMSPDGSFTYVPAADYSGEDTFSYQVSDGELSSSASTVRITVSPVNDAPVAVDDSYNVDENCVLATMAVNGALSNDADPEGTYLMAILICGTVPRDHGIEL